MLAFTLAQHFEKSFREAILNDFDPGMIQQKIFFSKCRFVSFSWNRLFKILTGKWWCWNISRLALWMVPSGTEIGFLNVSNRSSKERGIYFGHKKWNTQTQITSQLRDTKYNFMLGFLKTLYFIVRIFVFLPKYFNFSMC